MADAEYKVIDPQARGPEAIERAFENQVAYCRDNGAPITASVNQALREFIHKRKQIDTLKLFRQINFNPDYDYKKGAIDHECTNGYAHLVIIGQ